MVTTTTGAGIEAPAPAASPPVHSPMHNFDSQQPASMPMLELPPLNPFAGDGASSSFSLADWHLAYQNCQRYFVNHSQYGSFVQAVASFVNIRLPFQWPDHPVTQLPTERETVSSPASPVFPSASRRSPQFTANGQSLPFISLFPYIRRLVVTGYDSENIMCGFFGNDWQKGVGPVQTIERRNYMFAAKSVGWGMVKLHYENTTDEMVPYMTPLQRVKLNEIEIGEKAWSDWLAMEDWMIGPRTPRDLHRPLTTDTTQHDLDVRDEMVQDP
jgi:hypothetical protein